MNRKVNRAVLHDGLHIPAIGTIGKTLTVGDPQFKFREIEMEWEAGSGLLWKLKGCRGLVPAASVFSVEFAPDEQKATPLKAAV